MATHFPKGKPALSPEALSIWAKTAFYGRTDDDSYLQLWQHLEDTGEVALHVWDDFVSDNIKELLAEDIGDREVAKELYQFIAAIHDIGKGAPSFIVQSTKFADKVKQTKLSIKAIVGKDLMRSEYRHELVGYAAVIEWFCSQGFPVEPGTFAYGVACVVAGHHGKSLTDDKQALVDPLQRGKSFRGKTFMGDKAWTAVRDELLDWIAETLHAQPILYTLRNRSLRRRTQILLTSMVVMADWIASDSRLFPLNQGSVDEQIFDARYRADKAWRMLRIPEPWNPFATGESPDEMFAERFSIPGAHMRPVQREAARLARTMQSPGLMIVEANMGEGKTEAALIAAEILAARFQCGGIYYALPSQATVNAMFTRVLDWVGHLPSDEQGQIGSLFLAHGKNNLNDEYEHLREQWFDDGGEGLDAEMDLSEPSVGSVDAEYDGIDRYGRNHAYDDHSTMQAVVNSWLTGYRRGNLSDFVVGTIDQVLMAGLRSKYVVLRHLALAGKVVILDEVHSNTAYMNVYMETVLSWLGAYGVPAIMLSATLPQEKRQAFLDAYRNGASAASKVEAEPVRYSKSALSLPARIPLPSRIPPMSAGNIALPRRIPLRQRKDVVRNNDEVSVEPDMRYPLISVISASEAPVAVAPEPSGRATDIEVSLMDDGDEALVSLLRKNLQDGGCAVVIRDTVSRAQATYQMLCETMGDDMDIMLDHSRFLAVDRARIDRGLIDRYGRYGSVEGRSGIVVATQVVEQSLDVDFDLMITDIAPIDLILQRAGRLHRHHRGDGENLRPELLRQARLVITGVSQWERDAPPQFATGVDKVYQPYLLMRSLAVLDVEPGVSRRLNIPGDIPRLVQTVYGKKLICPGSWQDSDYGERAAQTKLEDSRTDSEHEARRFRIFQPQSPRHPFDINGWLDATMTDADTPGGADERISRAGIREGEDSFEVIVLQQQDGELMLPSWCGFKESERILPSGFGAPTRQQVRDILSCTISLSRTSLKYMDLDEVIKAFERATPDPWYDYMQLDRSLAGQLMIALDENGIATYQIPKSDKDGTKISNRTLTVRYSMEKGWQVDADE